MESLMILAGMTAAMGLSLWLALGLTWLLLRGAFHLMPVTNAKPGQRLRVIRGAAARAPKAQLASVHIAAQAEGRGKESP